MTLQEDNEKILDELRQSKNDMALALSTMEIEFNRIHNELYEVKETTKTVLGSVGMVIASLDEAKLFLQQFALLTEMRDNVTHAQGQIVILNQEIEKKFGLYDKVRKVLLGILQSVDTGLVSKNAIVNSTEKLMLSTPRYWLTPSLIAIAAWLTDNKVLAVKALNEGLKRNTLKTLLMFTLVNNRLKRNSASFIWLSKFFEYQNPLEMPQETIVLLSAYTDGFFGPDSHGICKKEIDKWISVVSKNEKCVSELEKTWYNRIDLLEYQDDSLLKFKYLPKYSPTYPTLEKILNNARKQITFLEYLKNIVESPVRKIDYVHDLDDLLFKLVNEYDSDEFELKKQKRMAELIVKYQGDKEKAKQDFETNTIILFNDKVSFFEVLLNAFDQSEKSVSLKKFALLLMKKWIHNANKDFVSSYRSSYPKYIQIQIGEWIDNTSNGANVSELLASYKKFLKNEMKKALKGAVIRLIVSIVALAGVFIWHSLSAPLNPHEFLLLIAGITFVWQIITLTIAIIKRHAEFNSKCEQGKTIINGCCAEFVDWQRMFKEADKVPNDISTFLSNYNADEFSSHNAKTKI